MQALRRIAAYEVGALMHHQVLLRVMLDSRYIVTNTELHFCSRYNALITE